MLGSRLGRRRFSTAGTISVTLHHLHRPGNDLVHHQPLRQAQLFHAACPEKQGPVVEESMQLVELCDDIVQVGMRAFDISLNAVCRTQCLPNLRQLDDRPRGFCQDSTITRRTRVERKTSTQITAISRFQNRLDLFLRGYRGVLGIEETTNKTAKPARKMMFVISFPCIFVCDQIIVRERNSAWHCEENSWNSVLVHCGEKTRCSGGANPHKSR